MTDQKLGKYELLGSLGSGATFDHYRVQKWVVDGGTPMIIFDQNVPGLTNSRVTVPAGVLALNITYSWRVCSYNTLGKYSNWSVTFHFHTR